MGEDERYFFSLVGLFLAHRRTDQTQPRVIVVRVWRDAAIVSSSRKGGERVDVSAGNGSGRVTSHTPAGAMGARAEYAYNA